MKTDLQWRSEDVGHARTVRYLPKRTAHMEGNQAKREKCVVGSKTGKEVPSKSSGVAMELQDLLDFVFCLGSLFLPYIPPFF